MDYYSVYKPYGMLCQFSQDGDKPTLRELDKFPRDVYPVGRLDTDSEGLLILTNDKRLNNALLNPENKHYRTYLIQVEGLATPQAIHDLESGVEIRIDKKNYRTMPARARIVKEAPTLPARNPPIRFRESVPTSWLELKLQEGKNRQVKRMTAKVGFPTLRLVRWAIEELSIDGMKPGDVQRLEAEKLYDFLNIRTIKN
ncbi:pseudouridine synthase [Cryomorpha ignava]|uniref:Pseudouridine synthase n=1 Tax=Cryomorpha ignava TaxID=101383 RepID=A0A7K3WQ40_9FLAO|nr:pseudouridine synthase [Cryomorpha ignava]NEN23779.1 pseudouridine synthase [Cryomorpha ignava]